MGAGDMASSSEHFFPKIAYVSLVRFSVVVFDEERTLSRNAISSEMIQVFGGADQPV